VAAIDPGLRVASVRLAVGDLDRSVDFYERVVGLALLSREGARARLGTDPARPALVLEDIERPTALSPGTTGLFHVAWLHPSRASLANSVRRVVAQRWRFDGAADHGVSEALYLTDPDGLGIELYADRPRERWLRPPGGGGVQMFTLPLDLEDLLAQDPGGPVPAIPEGATLGHVHLKVSEVPRSTAFYRDTLGFEEQASMPSAAFLSAGGYHHHIGLNSWQSEGADAPPESAPGLREVEFELAGPQAVHELERRLDAGEGGAPADREQNGSVSVRDPDGQLLTFGSR
jgi:catechol 2,3-dioxygenase